MRAVRIFVLGSDRLAGLFVADQARRTLDVAHRVADHAIRAAFDVYVGNATGIVQLDDAAAGTLRPLGPLLGRRLLFLDGAADLRLDQVEQPVSRNCPLREL
jgi:hypothetical protein